MTKKEIIRALQKRLGIRLVDQFPEDCRRTTLSAVSKNGTILFTITIYLGKDGWYFGGTGSLLNENDLWKELCVIGDPRDQR